MRLVPRDWRHALFVADSLAVQSEHLRVEAEAIEAQQQAWAVAHSAAEARSAHDHSAALQARDLFSHDLSMPALQATGESR